MAKPSFVLIIILTLSLTGCDNATPITPPALASPAFTKTLPPKPTLPTINKVACRPTFSDPASPTYRADAPIRSIVGQGLVLRGVVRSSQDCGPIAAAKLEFWPEAPDGGHPDQFRSTLFTDQAGAYQFQCNPTDHIHMRISAAGFTTIFSNAYHPHGKTEDNFDIVLVPTP